MPPAARVSDTTGHGIPLSPGPGSPTVLIGGLPAWRALPAGVGAAIQAVSNAMFSFMALPALTPATAVVQLAQIQSGLNQAAGAASAQGNPAAAAVASSAVAGMVAANVTLSATWAVASVVPGGQPAANIAYTEGIKGAAATAAAAVFSSVAGMTDTHICPVPFPIPPHGPGMVTMGSQTVLIAGLPAARQGDLVYEAVGGPAPIAMGCLTVLISDATPAVSKKIQAISKTLINASQAGIPLVSRAPECPLSEI